jgi:hypothetical protein
MTDKYMEFLTMPIKNRPLTPLMIEALISRPFSRSFGQWPKKRQIHALMARDLVRKDSLASLSAPYRFRLTSLGIKIKKEILSITPLTREIVSGGPHQPSLKRKRATTQLGA